MITTEHLVQNNNHSSSRGTKDRPVLAVLAVLVGSFLTNFHSRLFSIGLADLRGAFSLSFDEGSWLATASMAPQIVVAPVVVWLVAAFGIRRVLIGPGLLYVLVSLLIPLSTSFETLLALSILHALLLGAFVPATIMIIFRVVPVAWRLVAVAIYCLRVGYAQNVGLWSVGFYMEHLSWHWLYWQDVVPSLLMTSLVYWGTAPQSVDWKLIARADWGGMLLFGSGLAMIYAALDQGNRLDWLGSGIVASLLLCGALLLAGFFVNELLVSDPWALPGVMAPLNVAVAMVLLILYAVTNLSNTFLVPNFLLVIAKLRPEQVGPLLLTYVAVPMTLIAPLAVYLMRKCDVRLVLMVGLSSFAASGLLGTKLTHQWAPYDFVPILLFQALGQAFVLLPVAVIVLSNADPARTYAFSAYVQVARLGSAEIGSALIATWVRVREQAHSNWLGSLFENGDVNVTVTVAKLSSKLIAESGASASQHALNIVSGIVQREATVLSYVDGFWLTFVAAVVALALVALIGSSPPGPFGAGTKPSSSGNQG